MVQGFIFFSVQAGASIHRAVWNWYGKTLMPGVPCFFFNIPSPIFFSCHFWLSLASITCCCPWVCRWPGITNMQWLHVHVELKYYKSPQYHNQLLWSKVSTFDSGNFWNCFVHFTVIHYTLGVVTHVEQQNSLKMSWIY